jgi:hypothetical protein
MSETILNIYIVINEGNVVEFRAAAYEHDGGDESKKKFLKQQAADDFAGSYHFDAPSDKNGNFMSYDKFAKLEKRGRQFELFEEIFRNFNVPENPLICVTPVVDGKILSNPE